MHNLDQSHDQRIARLSHATLAAAVALTMLAPLILLGPTAAGAMPARTRHPLIATAHHIVKAPKRSKKSLAAANKPQSNLVDHGGPVIADARIYAVWWGKAAATSVQKRVVEPAVTNFLAGLGSPGSSTLLANTDQYMRGARASARFMKSYYDDGSKPPAQQPRISTIVSEVAKVVSAAGDSLDPGALYLVFTTNYPSDAPYCAWHSAGAVDGTWIAVGYMPNIGRAAGCAAPDSGSGIARGAQALVNVTSHEVLEATTDSMLEDRQAWTDARGEEIADKCAWRYPTDSAGTNIATWIGGQPWILQQEWSNKERSCV